MAPSSDHTRARLSQLQAHFDRDPSSSPRATFSSSAPASVSTSESPSPSPTFSSCPAPTLILIFGGTSISASTIQRHYGRRHSTLWPDATIVPITCILSDFLPWPVSNTASRIRDYEKILNALTVTASAPDKGGLESPQILAHVISGGGTLRFAAIAEHYRKTTGTLLPIKAIIFDSAPTRAGLISRAETIASIIAHPPKRLSPAATLASSSASKFISSLFLSSIPWLLTFLTWSVSLLFAEVWATMTLQRDALWFGWAATLDPKVLSTGSSRGYVYSIEDEIVDFRDVERHAALAEKAGWRVKLLKASGSGHMGHAKALGEQYWHFIREAWEEKKLS